MLRTLASHWNKESCMRGNRKGWQLVGINQSQDTLLVQPDKST